MAVVRIVFSIFLSIAGCVASCGQKTVSLAWDPSPETNVVAYYIYFGVESGVYTNRIEVGNTNSCQVCGLVEGVTYYFVVTSADADGLESDPSNEVAYLVPGLVRIQKQNNRPVSVTFPVSLGQWYELQATENLETWDTLWSVIGLDNSWVEFLDGEAVFLRQRFYRVVMH